MKNVKKKNPSLETSEEQTNTRTEIADNNDSKIAELLKEAQELDPALVVIQGEQLGQVFHLKQGTTTLGRHPDCDINVKQRAVSGIHAEFKVLHDGTVLLADKNSTNGVILNQQKIDRPVLLRANDLIKIGSQVLKFLDKHADTKLLEKIQEQGKIDSLTGVWLKGPLLQALRSSLDIAKRGYPLSIILLDIDHFKKINDTYGHLAGDYVLKEICRVLKETGLRSEDVFGRFGGEEFMLILPDSPLKVAESIAERMRKNIEKHNFVYDEKNISVTSSFGVCQWKAEHVAPEDLIEECDKALYSSKSSGRNKVTCSGKSS
jgi:two-component system cell cycle response regulator